MRTIAVIIAIIAISGLAFAQDTADRQNRVVLEVIPLQYLDVQTAIAIFGGTIIPSYGQRML
ncbi:MAG: hypothetical protein J7M38_09045, partial [Armatimonadetes bacterium]|nr:hypothetical protein [Armatimonadota bacterium]